MVDQPAKLPQNIDDTLLVMDVVDTVRHANFTFEETATTQERTDLTVRRLREIYDAQGIEISDDILVEGLSAFKENRFDYVPVKGGLGFKLARIYIYRRRWLPLAMLVSVIAGAAFAINYFGFVRPTQIKASKIERLLTTDLPSQLTEARTKALAASSVPAVSEKIETLYADGEAALNDKNITSTQASITTLQNLSYDLGQSYVIQVVSRPREYSGVFRLHDDNENVRNYYLIVEGINAAGERLTVRISSEEDNKTARVQSWGVRVPVEVFNRIAADKKDDQIIQNAIIGLKARGTLDPEYSVKTSGGLILDW